MNRTRTDEVNRCTLLENQHIRDHIRILYVVVGGFGGLKSAVPFSVMFCIRDGRRSLFGCIRPYRMKSISDPINPAECCTNILTKISQIQER